MNKNFLILSKSFMGRENGQIFLCSCAVMGVVKLLPFCFVMIMDISILPASKPPPIQTAKFNGDFVPKPTMTQVAHSKLEHIKAWSVNTYKCTKQLLSEKLGKSSRTVDLELEAQIEVLRDTQRKYSNILRLSRSLMVNFTQVVQTQRALGEAFSEQAQRSVELQEEFTYNCETQRALVKNGETLLGE